MQSEIQKYLKKLEFYQNDWNAFARDKIGVKLDPEQQECLYKIQENKRVSIRSGNSRGKDYLAAVASVTFLSLYAPSKVINTAPTGRQVESIMMAEIGTLYENAKDRSWLVGIPQANKIKCKKKNRYLLGFKAQDKKTEAWTGFHSPNLLVVVSEASGAETETFDAIESVMMGENTKLLIVFNALRTSGEAYKSCKDPKFVSIQLNCLNAPNVKAQKIIYPGQIDFDFVKEKVSEWCFEINPDDVADEYNDFQWIDKKWYRPNDSFRKKIIGAFPTESTDQLIPLSWVEASNQRWLKLYKGNGHFKYQERLRLGVDIAGEGRDNSCFVPRYGNKVPKLIIKPRIDHIEAVGIAQSMCRDSNDVVLYDTIGEGSGCFPIARKEKKDNDNFHIPVSAKFSFAAHGLRDLTGENEFAKMRDYCWWAIRDSLDPQHKIGLALPPVKELTEDLTEPMFSRDSQGRIVIEKKEDIKKRLGRSTDWGDALALSYFPYTPARRKRNAYVERA